MLDRLTIERMVAAAGDGPILLALSGGGDSVALLHLLAERLGATRLRAAVVDHALRAGSADDARCARGLARALGVEAVVLTLAWAPGGANRAQQAARQARYGLLCGHARTIGARVVAAGHTAEDQAETVLMRAAAGSSWRGLAGIAPLAPVPLWPEGRGLMLARPLLGARRQALRELLRARGAEWIEDPANTNPVFERVRARAALSALEAGGLDPTRLARLAERLRPRAEALASAAAALIARAARFDGGRIVVDPSAWRSGGLEVRRRALSALIAAAAGAAREPPAEPLARLEDRIAGLSFEGATLGGAQISQASGCIVVERDRGGVEGRADGAPGLSPVDLPAGEELVWDGRLALCASAAGIRAVARGATPRFLIGGVEAPDGAVRQRWLLAERTAHALATLPVADAPVS